MERKAILVIAAAALTVLISTGIRQSFGIFLAPVSESLGTGRELFSLAIAVQNLIFGLPLIGIIADRVGSRAVVVVGGLLYVVGLVLMPLTVSAAGLFGSLGVLVGLALSGTTYVVVLGAVAQVVAPEKRTRTFGIITATGSAGMFVVPPIAQWLLSSFAWQGAFVGLAGLALGMIGLAFWLPNRPVGAGAGVVDESFLTVLNRARRHSGYLLLIAGFFVCGFHVSFIATHLPAFLTDNDLPPEVGGWALALIGVANIFGSYTFGRLGDRYRKKYLLSFLYASRAVVITLFLVVPLTTASALIFGTVIGFLWLATVPLTSGTVAQIFGVRYLSTLYGIVFLSHQVGAFLGVWLGGRVFDATGSYQPVWLIAVGLSLFAALVHTPISDAPLVRAETQAA